MQEVSNEFLAVQNMGGCLVTDCICGLTHFATNAEGWYDEGELQNLRAKAAEGYSSATHWALFETD